MKCKACPVSLILLLFSFSTLAQNTYQKDYLETEMDPNASIISNTESSQNHKMLLAAMRAAELEEILSFDGPFTVFAPSDLAFEKLPRDTVAELLDPTNKKEVQALMTYHIIAGNFSASKILRAMCRGEGKATFTTVHGDLITATMQGVDIVLTDNFGNRAKITTADSNQCNGVIHEIDTVIRPSKL
ncbi:fasciclin domain-containing protein [Maribacter algarum]|uniref:Fasciclin domain-containing protein n=1 Tax=Maribacter algarum (ex Zhang et al. 2020) TaxID=2578118 RepID=A0A5S3PVF7_9FLAO|nr:fasciclin domain-containing protein [Maribacter algarum]TMM56948.1 fasciclin domain-containing protein [Maribacter algarum]